jgi:hypothetical protein
VISDRDTAKQILDELFDLSGRLDWSVATVRDRCPESELIVYRRAIGTSWAKCGLRFFVQFSRLIPI